MQTISFRDRIVNPRGVVRGLIRLLIIIVSAAWLFTLLLGGSFRINLIFAICIGGLCHILIRLGWHILGQKKEWPSLSVYVLLVIVSFCLAYVFGMMLAGWLLGIPLGVLAQHVGKHATVYATFSILISWIVSSLAWNRGRIVSLQADAAEEKARAAAIEKQAMQAQLQLLQAQIEPHMLFNTLANVQGMITIDPIQAQRMLDQLILYLRATLSSSRAATTTLAQEFSLIEAYLDLMSVRLGERLSFSLNLPVDLREICVPPMLLQPLVENAIQHGIEPKMDGGHIAVSAAMQHGRMILTISDTGLGMNAPSANKSDTHIGLANIRERLQGLYGDSASLSLIAGQACGTIAQLDLPSESH